MCLYVWLRDRSFVVIVTRTSRLFTNFDVYEWKLNTDKLIELSSVRQLKPGRIQRVCALITTIRRLKRNILR